MPRVIVPPPYQGPTGGRGEVVVEAATVRACVEAVDARFPGFREQIFDGGGGIHRFVKLFRNGDPVDARQVDQRIDPGDTIEVVAAIAGG
jgi:molybdopterin converting factor small subunit